VNYKIETRIAIPVPTNPVDGKLHLPNGKHYMLDFRDVDHVGLAFLETASGESFLSQEITRSGMTVLGSQSHRFPGGGLSLVFLLAESHMSIHSWPEHSFVAIDIYTCGDSSAAEHLVDSMHALLKPSTAKVSKVERGSNLTHSIRDNQRGTGSLTLFDADRPHTFVLPATVDICVNGDFDGDDCFLWRDASLLFSERSDVQLVEVVERRSSQRCLLLDGAVQFCNSTDDDLYTRSLTNGAMHPLLQRSADVDVYVIGGGDGWVSNYLIDTYSSVIRSIRVIDIDPLVSYATQKFFPTNKLSSFQDPRVTYIAADAASWLRNAPNESVDAVIIDCTDHTVGVLSLVSVIRA
jgi:spermidine synthase